MASIPKLGPLNTQLNVSENTHPQHNTHGQQSTCVQTDEGICAFSELSYSYINPRSKTGVIRHIVFIKATCQSYGLF